MMRPSLAIAVAVTLEARRAGLPWLALGSLAAGLTLGALVSSLALTESGQVMTAVLAAGFRLCAVFVTVVFVATSMSREASDKGTEFLLAMPISRTEFYLGKLAGYSICSVVLAGLYSLALMATGSSSGLFGWFISLSVECALMSSICLFFAVGLRQMVSVLSASAGLYLLSRVSGATQAIASGPLVDEASLSQQIASWLMEGIALLLPSLDSATRTAWLLQEPPSWSELSVSVGAMLIYAALVSVAGLFDLARRNL